MARLHDVYGSFDRFEGGWENAPAAICRKVARAESGGVIDVWGACKPTRSFIYVGDCVEGLQRLMSSDCPIPVNLDTGEMATVDELVGVVAHIAGKAIRIRHLRWMPQDAGGCNSDSALLRHVLQWEPQVSLSEGLARTYAWIAAQLPQRGESADFPALSRVAAKGRQQHAVVAAA